MSDIDFLNDDILTLSSKNVIFEIQMRQTRSSLRDIDDFVNFIKACERKIRTSDEYSRFKAQLMEQGLNRDQILGGIESDGEDGVTIEMHHGPILTLFDYCAIIVDYHLAHDESVTTFQIIREVLDEHWAGHVQTVMLSKTPHQLVDSGEMFIHFNQARGNLNAFLQKYRDGLTPDRVEKINRYIDMCEQFDSFDNGLFDLKNTITDWNYDVALERMKQ